MRWWAPSCRESSGTPRRSRPIHAYALAVAAPCTALLISYVVWPVLGPTRSPLFLAAVVVSTWYGGLGPGLLTTAIAFVAKLYVVMPPAGFQVDDVTDALYLVVFTLVAVLVSTLTGALRRAETANRRLGAQEQEARAEAEAANRAKDVFLLPRDRHDVALFTKALEGLEHGIAAQGRLGQIECNLLSNALKFTPAEGRGDVRLDRIGERVRLIVADTGRGISPELLPRLFEEFWQGGDGGRASTAGLGLAIVRQLVEQHGGSVHAESAGVGQGARFVVELAVVAHRGDRSPASTGSPRAAWTELQASTPPGWREARGL